MQREIGIIIRVKDAAKAKEEIKNIVDTKLLGNVKLANTEFKKLGDEVQRTGSNAKGATSQFDNMFKRMASGVGILYTLRRGLTAAFGSFEAGAGLERAAVQFESSIGKVNEFLPQLRNATRGTVEDMKLLSTANRAVMEGLNPKSLTKMYQMATVASRKLGLESEQAIQTISNAIVRQDESALTTLGTILKTNIGLKVQTAIMSKNAGVMSGAAAIAIRQSVIMAELNKRFGGFNQLQEDGVEIIQQFRAAMSNLRITIGPIIGIVFAPLLKVVTQIANSLSHVLTLLKDNKVFRSVVQSLGLVIAAMASAKVVGLLTLVIGKIGLFVGGLKAIAMAAAVVTGLSLFSSIKEVGKAFEFAGTAMRVFYHLISNFDDQTGVSQVLIKDKQALGDFFKYVKMGAQAYLIVKSAITGIASGISSAIDSTLSTMGNFISKVSSFVGSVLSFVAPIDNVVASINSFTAAVRGFFDSLSLNHLKGIERIFKSISSTLYAPKLAMTVPNLLMDGASYASSAIQGMMQPSTVSAPVPTPPPPPAMMSVPPEPQIREQNITAVSSTDEALRAMAKDMKLMRESNEQINRREEEQMMTDRLRPITR